MKIGLVVWLFLFLSMAVYPQWNYVNPTGTAENYTALHFVDPFRGYAMTTYGVLMSTSDRGNRWSKVVTSPRLSGFFLDMTFTSAMEGTVVGAGGRILHTRDGGLTWDSIESGTSANLQSVFMYSPALGFIAGLHGTVLKTTDGGLNWSRVPSNLDRDLYDCWFVSPSKGFVAADKSVFRTQDGGITWELVLLADSGRNFIRVAFTDTLLGFAVGRNGAIFKTSDGGNNWTGTPSGTNRYLFSLSMVGPQTIYVTGSGALILKSTDSGATWNVLPVDFPFDFGSVVFTDEATGTVIGPLGAILHTDDGGATWIEATFSTLDNMWDCSFRDSHNGFACGANGSITGTSDGGDTWSERETGTTSTLNTISMVPPLTGYAAGEGGALIKTDDGGLTWRNLSSPEPVSWQNLFFNDPLNGFLVGIGQLIWHTANGGQSWDSFNTGSGGALNDIDFFGPLGYVCGSGATLLQTKDGGVSWQQIKIPELCEANLNKICCIDENNCYITGNQYIDNANTMFFARTHNQGESWQIKTFAYYPSKYFTALCFTGPMTGYIGGTGFIWKTMDGGDRWMDQTMDERQVGPNQLTFISDEVGFSISYFGQILKTDNGGGIGFSEPALTRVPVLGQNYPNPFFTSTCISYHLQEKGNVKLVLYDAIGHYAGTLIDQYQLPGDYIFNFDGSGLPGGFYFYQLFTGGWIETGKMVKK